MVKEAQKLKEAYKTRTLESYWETAHPGQVEFHKAASLKRIRYFFGDNRSGKSTAGFVEDIQLALGRQPFLKKWKTPAKGLVVIQDFENHGKNILEPKFTEWAPRGSIVKTDRNQNGAWRKIYFNTGTVIDVLSHDQDVKVFEGADYDWAHFDEPPPKHIFTAVWRGLIDRGGIMFLTATPLMSPWLYKEFKTAQLGDPLRWHIYVSNQLNATNLGEGDEELGKKRIQEFVDLLDPDEKALRAGGEFIQMRGLIFKGFDRQHHMIKAFQWPQEWPIIESIDPHPHKPWAVSWTGIAENGCKVLLRSGLYEGVIEEIANQIIYERSNLDISGGNKPRIKMTLIDNSASVPIWSKSNTDPTARRISVREELENMIGPLVGGPRITVAPKNVKQKIDVFKQWLHISKDENGRPSGSKFYAFDTQENERFVYEIENYVWDTSKADKSITLKTDPKKIDDDILDSIMQVCLTYRDEPTERPAPIKVMGGNSWRVSRTS